MRWLVVITCFIVCGAAVNARAGTVVAAPSADTFINSDYPSNNNGGSNSFFTGQEAHGGVMRTLVQFSLPPTLRGRATAALSRARSPRPGSGGR
jgi:hypothetical protein